MTSDLLGQNEIDALLNTEGLQDHLDSPESLRFNKAKELIEKLAILNIHNLPSDMRDELESIFMEKIIPDNESKKEDPQ